MIMITYKATSRGVLKDGHTMFADDISRELNRKAHLEELLINNKKEIEGLKKMIDNGIGWADLENDIKPF